MEKTGLVYSCGDLKIAPMPSEDDLGKIYYRLKSDGTYDSVFYEYDLSLSQFLRVFTDASRAPLGCYGPDISGLCWLNRQEILRGGYRRAEVAMGFYRGQSIERLETFGKMAIEWAFDKLELNVILGVTPAANRAALLFSRRLGFDVVGPVRGATVWNGEACDVYISSMAREKLAQ
jgi:hypothetical protein